MARPVVQTIVSDAVNWDVDVNINFENLFEYPFPINVVADVGSLPTAGSYDDCFAWVTTPGALYRSNGSSWVLYGSTTGITQLTDNSGGTGTDTLALVNQSITGVDGTGNNAASVTEVNTAMGVIADAIASLRDKITEIQGALD